MLFTSKGKTQPRKPYAKVIDQYDIDKKGTGTWPNKK